MGLNVGRYNEVKFQTLLEKHRTKKMCQMTGYVAWK